MDNFVCFVTGPIVGLRNTWFLDETVRFAATLGKKIKAFFVLDEVLEAAGLHAANAYEKAASVSYSSRPCFLLLLSSSKIT